MTNTSSREKTATIIGATGLIGSHLLEVLLTENYYRSIKVMARRPVTINDPKVLVNIVNFADDESFRSAIAGTDAVFCCVGTTQTKVKGDKTAYRKVDYDIPVNAARFCAETGCPRFLTVSSVGADSKSNNFYLRLKGEVEDSLKKMNIPYVSIFRPSILLGKRKEFRFAEMIAKGLSEFFSFLIPSGYKPVRAEDVAKSMAAASRQDAPGVHIYHYHGIRKLIQTS